jgi:GNAT superfamily N-acetyltransferase
MQTAHKTFREATFADIPAIQLVRNSVKENPLSDPGLITDADCATYITERGKGWVCEVNDQIVGFAIADLQDNNIWALFLHPDFEGQGIGRQLHGAMLDWYFDQCKDYVWLSTAPGTRAETFYRRAGWEENGIYGKGEIRFEMSKSGWNERKQQR